MFLAFILFGLGIFLFLKIVFKKKKSENKPLSDGEVLNNSYIIRHEQKMKDDAVYDEYLEWCKVKGELPVDKEGFDEYRMKEYHMYKKLLKTGIGGIYK